MLKNQNEKLLAKLQSTSDSYHDKKSYEKDPNLLSKISYYDHNKENDFKDEMLKLPIFQKNRMNQPV